MIVPHTVPRVGRSYEHFPDGFELHLLPLSRFLAPYAPPFPPVLHPAPTRRARFSLSFRPFLLEGGMTNWPRNATHPTVFPASLLLLPLALLPPPPSVTPLFLTFPAPLSRRAGPTRLILPRGSLAPLSSAPPLELRFTPCTTQRLAPSPAPALRSSWGSSADHAPATDRPAVCSVLRRPSRLPIRLPHRRTHPASSSALPRSVPRWWCHHHQVLPVLWRKKTKNGRPSESSLEGPAFQLTPQLLRQLLPVFAPHHHSLLCESSPHHRRSSRAFRPAVLAARPLS
jgi:hypothetical protein